MDWDKKIGERHIRMDAIEIDLTWRTDGFRGFTEDGSYYIGLEVGITVTGYQVSFASLWGIRADAGDEAMLEYEREVTDRAIQQVRPYDMRRIAQCFLSTADAFDTAAERFLVGQETPADQPAYTRLAALRDVIKPKEASNAEK